MIVAQPHSQGATLLVRAQPGARRNGIFGERGDALREIAKSSRQLSLRATLIHVRVPTAHVSKRDFESNVRLDQLRDLQQVLTKGRARILHASGSFVLLRIGCTQNFERLEHLGAAAVYQI